MLLNTEINNWHDLLVWHKYFLFMVFRKAMVITCIVLNDSHSFYFSQNGLHYRLYKLNNENGDVKFQQKKIRLMMEGLHSKC